METLPQPTPPANGHAPSDNANDQHLLHPSSFILHPSKTGPKTPLGKSRSRMNAVKHGLRATDGLFLAQLSRYERAIFTEIRSALHNDYQPQTSQEKFLVDRIAIQYLRLYRLYSLEQAAARKSIAAPLAKESILPHLDRLSRYDWRIERQLRVLHNRLISLFWKRGNLELTHFSPKD